MPFEPKILRFDDEHGIGPPCVADPAREPGAFDTVSGLELATLRDWQPDDELLGGEDLQLLARQLADDAARLAERYPAAETTTADLAAFAVKTQRPAVRGWLWYRVAAASLLIAIGGLAAWHNRPDAALGPAIPVDHQASAPAVNTSRYENGDEATWGSPVEGAADTLPGGWPGEFFPETPGIAGDGLPGDSHGYCEVSM